MTNQADLSQILAMADAAYKRADTDPRFTPAAAQRIKATIYTVAKKQIDSLAAEKIAATAQRRRQLERSVFGLPDGHDAADATSYRNAVAQVTALDPIKGEADAKAMLLNAATIGDATLVRALVNVSFDRQWADVINAYEEENPAAASDADELWGLRNPSVQEVAAQAATGETGNWIPKPPGMRHIGDFELAKLAEPDPKPVRQRRFGEHAPHTSDGVAALGAAFEAQKTLDWGDAA